MLRQHLDRFVLADGVVQIVAHLGQKAVERRLLGAALLLDCCLDPDHMLLGDVSDILGPFLPIGPGAAFLDDARHDGAAELVHAERQLITLPCRRG